METSLAVDLVVLLHLGYVAFVVSGYALIPIGVARGWSWVRNRRYRLLHVAAIALVSLEALAGLVCPLTLLENQLRIAGGMNEAGGSFIGRLAHRVIYYDLPGWSFTVAYALLVGVALLLWRTVPPRPRG